MPPAVYTRAMSIRPRQDAAPIPAFPALGVFLSKLLAPPNEPDTSFCPKARRLGFSFARLFFFFFFFFFFFSIFKLHLQRSPQNGTCNFSLCL